MKRGSLYWVNLGETYPPEFGKLRPALIISNSDQNSVLDSVIIVPISSAAPAIWPLRIELKVPKLKTSYVVIPGIRQISKTRLQELIGQTPSSTLDSVDEALITYLSD